MKSTISLGKQGEGFTAKYFESKGFEIIARNFRYDRAEIDLVVKNERTRTLVFVEVKTRRATTFGAPEESVTESKQAQLVKSADGFLMSHEEFTDYEKRFDVAAVLIKNGKAEINHIENAF